jgi:HD-like signal output (HDOD) protein/GGDEF domain-containing protein
MLSSFVQRAQGLYTLPAVALKVLELTSSPQVDARAIKNCIENDPALAAKLLRVVNSSLFGLSRQVNDLNQALALMGVQPLKLLVLGFSLPKRLFEGLQAETLASYWRRTLTKATAARALSEAGWREGGEEAFLAGLLQDIGQLALVQDLGEPYARFLQQARKEGGDLPALELAAFGFDHAIFSARLLDHWNLPASLVRAVAERQEIEHLAALPEDQRRLAQTLHLAELTARVVADGQSRALIPLHQASRRYTRLTAQQLDGVLIALQQTVEQVARALNLEIGVGLDCRLLLEEASRLMAEAAPAATLELERAAEETALWQQAASLRDSVTEFLAGNGARRTPAPSANQADRWTEDDRARAAYEAALAARLDEAVNRCRQRRTGVSLLVAAVDQERRLVWKNGPEGVGRAAQLVMATGRALGDLSNECLALGGTRCVLMLENCERPQAVALARRWVEAVAQCTASREEWFGAPVTMSVGAATLAIPPRNFPPRELFEAAWRCLYAAQSAGGNTVKSIDIF